MAQNYTLDTPDAYDVRMAGQEFADKTSKINTLDNINRKATNISATIEEVVGKSATTGSKAGSGFIAGASRFLGPLGTLLTAVTPGELSGEGDNEIAAMSIASRDKANSDRIAQSSTDTAQAVTEQPNPMEALLLSASATASQDAARSKTRDVATSVGTARNTTKIAAEYVLTPGTRLVKTFGSTRVVDAQGKEVIPEQGNDSLIPANAKAPSVDLGAVVTNKVENTPKSGSFDIEKEFNSLRSLSGDERLDRANQLLVNIGMQTARMQDQVRAIAAQESGVNDAQAAYQNFSRLAQQIRPGQRVIEVEASRKDLNDAMIIANKREVDLIAANPELRRLKEYHDAITRDIQFTARKDDKKTARDFRQEEKDRELLQITPDRQANGIYALGMKEPQNAEEEKAARRAILDASNHDKHLKAVLDIDKNSIANYLTATDPKLRNLAFKVLRGIETKYATENSTTLDTDSLAKIEEMIKNPDAWIAANAKNIDPETTKRFKTEGMLSQNAGQAEKANLNANYRVSVFNQIMDKKFRLDYDRMQTWKWTDPSIKKVIDSTLNANAPSSTGNKNVSMEDGINAIVNAGMRAPDGRIMTFQDKKDATLASLEVTLSNDQKSFLRPSSEGYGPEFRDKVVNLFNRAWIRKEKPFVNSALENPFRF